MSLPLLKNLKLEGKRVIVRADLNVPVDANGNIINDARIKASIPTIKYLLEQKAAVILISHFGRPKPIKNLNNLKHRNLDNLPHQVRDDINLNEIPHKELDDKPDQARDDEVVSSRNDEVVSSRNDEVVSSRNSRSEYPGSKESSQESIKKYSLEVIISPLEKQLGTKVKFIRGNWVEGFDIRSGEVALCENVRFFSGETKNDKDLSKKMASIGDVFVMDAFGTAHRAHCSTEGIAHYIKEKAVGFLLEKEINALSKFLHSPEKPVLAIIAGSKVSTKLGVLNNFISKVDYLILGGGIANTFLKAEGYNIGTSIFEKDLVDEAKKMLSKALKSGTTILLPQDVVVAKDISNRSFQTKDLSNILDDDKILDVGEQTTKNYSSYIAKAKTILWNGPLGVFEVKNFAKGTHEIARAIANSDSFSIAGGGETIAAIEDYNIADKISYISTGGGAFLEFITGKELPAIKVLS